MRRRLCSAEVSGAGIGGGTGLREALHLSAELGGSAASAAALLVLACCGRARVRYGVPASRPVGAGVGRLGGAADVWGAAALGTALAAGCAAGGGGG
ncbi:MAG: hypothetical protein ACLP22_17190 [Solirubrobacteraceae bacterium]